MDAQASKLPNFSALFRKFLEFDQKKWGIFPKYIFLDLIFNAFFILFKWRILAAFPPIKLRIWSKIRKIGSKICRIWSKILNLKTTFFR